MAIATSNRSRFPLIYGLAALAVLLLGFAPTFFFRWLSNLPDLPAYLIVHGLAGTAWFLLFITQAVLAAGGKVQWHRQLGMAGVGIAVVLLASGAYAVIAFAQDVAARGDFMAANGSGPEFVYAVIAASCSGIVGFSGNLAAALAFRRRRDIHGRLMLLATAGLLGPAISRIVNWFVPLPNPLLGAVIVFLVAMIVYDMRTRGRPHIATVLGGLWTYGVVVLFMALGVGRWVMQHAAR